MKQHLRTSLKNTTLAKSRLARFVVTHPFSIKNLFKNIIKAPV